MTAAAEKWISLEPKIARNGQSWCLFISFVMRLRELVADHEALDRLRAENLRKADECGNDRQILRVLISILCDLRGKGWRFRLDDGAPAIAAPEGVGGSVLEQKERVRSSLLMERDSQLRTPAVRRVRSGHGATPPEQSRLDVRLLRDAGWPGIGPKATRGAARRPTAPAGTNSCGR